MAGIDAGGVYHEPIQEIRRCAEMGLRAVFIEPGRSPGCDLDDKRLYPIYRQLYPALRATFQELAAFEAA